MAEYSMVPDFVYDTFNYIITDSLWRDFWEIIRHYYPSIRCFVFSKETLKYIDEEAIVFSWSAWFIKKSTIMKYWREKQEWKIFIRREFFIKKAENIDDVSESYFEDAVKIRDIDEKQREENLRNRKPTEIKDPIEELLQWKDVLEVYPWRYYVKYIGSYVFKPDIIEKIPVYVKFYMTWEGYISISDVRKFWFKKRFGDGSERWVLKKDFLKETMKEVVEWEYNRLLWKEKWDSEDVKSFCIVWEDKFWEHRTKYTASEFYDIRKHHTRQKKQGNVRSWKECVMKFHHEWFESVKKDIHEFEWIEVPFTIYHQHVVDIEIDNMVWVRGKFKRQNNIYYLCMWEHQWMRLLAKDAPESFGKLEFEDRWFTIDFIEKDWKIINTNWERKAFKIYRNEE